MSAQTIDLAGRVTAVAEGRDGRLFLERGAGFDAQQLFGAPFEDDAGLEAAWRTGLERRIAMCREVGAVFVVLIAPEAHGVHSDLLPDSLGYALPSIADRFVALARSMGVTVVWPREALAAAKGPVEVYRRDDSHWSSYGAYIAYRELMAALPEGLSAGQVTAEAFSYAWEEALGDLAWTGPQARRRPTPRPVMKTQRWRPVLTRMNERRHALTITETDDASLPSLLIFRDSAATEMAPFLMESFRRTVFVGAADRGYLELIPEEAPQVVVLERSERTLLHTTVDWNMETWREAFPEPAADAAAQTAENAARAAFSAGDTAHALEQIDLALAREPTLDRRILAGRVRLAAALPAEAIVDLEAAVEEAPERWTALLQLGCAKMAVGAFPEARDLFARACVVAPWQPLGFEHFGYASLHMGDSASAIPALRTAMRLGPEFSGPYVWLHEALARQGRAQEAGEVLALARRNHPDDLLVQGLAVRQ